MADFWVSVVVNSGRTPGAPLSSNPHISPLKPLKLLALALLAIVTAPVAWCAAPASVGDTFLSFTYQAQGFAGAGVFYFAPDGTCRKFSLSTLNQAAAATVPTYDASASGTYTLIPSADDPNRVDVSVSMAGPGIIIGYYFSLEFTGPTSGNLNFSGQQQAGPLFLGFGTFSLLAHSQNNFLVNVSNRVTLRPSDTAIAGFVVQGSGSRLVLVRTVGPSLAEFGVSPVSMNPQLNVFQGTGTTKIGAGATLASGTSALGGYDAQALGWVFSMAGAFPLQSGANDSVYFSVLSPGVYTAQASDPTTPSSGGSALTEVYILPYSG
jgi:hypothetical protein